MNYNSSENIIYSCKYHVVWCPKYRKKILVEEVEKSLKNLIKKKCTELGSKMIELEIMPDHVHLLIEIAPQKAVGEIIGEIKGYTSYNLRKEYSFLKAMPTLWTNSYFVSTVGGAPLTVIKQYIENQKRK